MLNIVEKHESSQPDSMTPGLRGLTEDSYSNIIYIRKLGHFFFWGGGGGGG